MPRGTEEGTRFDLDRAFTWSATSRRRSRSTARSSARTPSDALVTLHDAADAAAARAARDRLPLRQAIAAGAARGPAERRLHRNRNAGALVPARETPVIAGGWRSTCAASKPIRSTSSPETEASHDEAPWSSTADAAVERRKRSSAPCSARARPAPPEALTGELETLDRATASTRGRSPIIRALADTLLESATGGAGARRTKCAG